MAACLIVGHIIANAANFARDRAEVSRWPRLRRHHAANSF
jgi:hypothetical protein